MWIRSKTFYLMLHDDESLFTAKPNSKMKLFNVALGSMQDDAIVVEEVVSGNSGATPSEAATISAQRAV